MQIENIVYKYLVFFAKSLMKKVKVHNKGILYYISPNASFRII